MAGKGREGAISDQIEKARDDFYECHADWQLTLDKCRPGCPDFNEEACKRCLEQNTSPACQRSLRCLGPELTAVLSKP